MVLNYILVGCPWRRGSASKQQGEKSSLITILFSSTSLYYFENSAHLKSLCANKSSVREGETGRKSRTAAAQSEFHRSYSRRNKQWNKPRSCLVCAVIEVSAVYRFCYKVRPNLTVLKSCMMLSGSSIMVLCFGRDFNITIYSLT